MIKFADRIKTLKPSPTLSINAKAKELKAKGVDIINLSAGEPDFDTPSHIKLACKKALDEGLTKYTPTLGILELRKAVCERLKSDYGFSYSPNEVIITSGAKQAIFNLILTLVNPGDEVIIFSPYWVSYPAIITIAGGVPVVVKTKFENNFEPTIEEIEKRITSKTVGMIINSPSNPTGVIYSSKFLKALGELIKQKDIWIISDDIYDKLRFDMKNPENILSVLPELRDRVFLVNGVSKTYAMTGWRIGWIVGPSEVIEKCAALQGQSTSHVTSFAQKGAEIALTSSQDGVRKMCEIFKERAMFLSNALKEIPGIKLVPPQGTFYLFPKVSEFYGKKINGFEIKDSISFSEFLLEKAKIAVVPGIAFGEDEFIRVSFATSLENLKIAVERLKKALEVLR